MGKQVAALQKIKMRHPKNRMAHFVIWEVYSAGPAMGTMVPFCIRG